MKIYRSDLIVIVVCLVTFFTQCSKGGNTLDNLPIDTLPTPSLPTDTLSGGWEVTHFDTSAIIFDVVFTTPDSGYFVGTKGVGRSTDGGRTWKYLNNSRADFLFVTSDRKVFYVILKYPQATLFLSKDGLSAFAPLITDDFSDLYFVSADTGFISVKDGKLLQTIDGGISWKAIVNLSGNTWSDPTLPFFIDNKTGWIGANNGVYRSTDSINTWEKCSFTTAPVFAAHSSALVFAPTKDTVFTTVGGNVYRSENGGKVFDLVFQSPRPTEFSDLYFINSLEGYVTCDNTIYRTNNGGNTWERVVYLADGGLFELHFTDKNHGWAVGARGTILIFKR